MTLLAGARFGPYEILSPLGAGGMGEVYRARDSKLGRDAAIKVLPETVAQDAERLARFEREARALAALNHPGIVTIFSVEEAAGMRVLAMELVEGESLDMQMASGGLPLARFFDIATPLAEALSAAHERGIVHRDLKPGNVMVTPDGRVKVLDFGLARIEGPDSDPNVTSTPTESRALLTGEGQVFGTVAYMSPEQARGGKVDARSDVFSLGVVLYQMLTGERPFQGASSVDLISSILRDRPPSVSELRSDLPPHLSRILRRCLEKDPRDRYQTSRDVYNELKDLRAETSSSSVTSRPASGPVRTEEGFWIAVLPFQHRGASPELEDLAEGMTDEILTGLSRFSHLRVISRSSTRRFAVEAADAQTVGREIGARYVLDGNLRQAGSALRVSVQLIDALSGAHLWAEAYNRPFAAEKSFELQDDLVPRIVSTVADMSGVLPRSMSDALRQRDPESLSPYEATLCAFGYFERLTAPEHSQARDALERAVRSAPDQADCLAMLSMMYAEEHKHGFNPRPDPLDRALDAARRAVQAAPSNHLAHQALAQVLFFRRDLQAFRKVADRAVALNPMDGSSVAYMGILMAYAGDWEHGVALAARAMGLNPNYPGWFWFAALNDAMRKRDFHAALDVAVRMNLPSYYHTHVALATAYASLGQRAAAARAVAELLALKPGYAAIAREDLRKWMGDGELLEIYMDGLRKAGLEIAVEPRGADVPSAASSPVAAAAVAIAVLPFADMSPAQDQQYLGEGMAEEVMNALVRIDGIRVASRTSAFRASREEKDLAAIGRALSVEQVLEGSVRTSGGRLRVTAQLSDVATGYQLWSERFERGLEDVFSVQDEIARGVVEAVKARLAPGAGTVRARAQARDFDAYRSYLLGQHLRYAKEDHGGAVRAFQEAVRLDPTHAPSWTGLAESLMLMAHMSLIPAREACARAREALATAARLQGESADGLHGEAFVAFIERRWKDMETASRRAIELQPTHVPSLGVLGMCLSLHQKPDEAAPFFERAREADPLASFPYMLTALGLLTVKRHRDAHRYAEQALIFEKDDASALYCAALANVALGQFDQGIAAAEHVVALTHRGGDFIGLLGWALATAGRKDEARTILEELRARPAAAPQIVSEGWLLGALGEIDAAFDALARAEDQNQLWLYYSGLPGFDPLRADPRFTALFASMGLPAG